MYEVIQVIVKVNIGTAPTHPLPPGLTVPACLPCPACCSCGLCVAVSLQQRPPLTDLVPLARTYATAHSHVRGASEEVRRRADASRRTCEDTP